jgi:hypothetical protein
VSIIRLSWCTAHERHIFFEVQLICDEQRGLSNKGPGTPVERQNVESGWAVTFIDAQEYGGWAQISQIRISN